MSETRFNAQGWQGGDPLEPISSDTANNECDFCDQVLRTLWPLPQWQRFSREARVGFIAIGQGMRLYRDNTKKRSARLGPHNDPKIAKFYPKGVVELPQHVAQEMIGSGLMKNICPPGTAEIWCMIQ